MVRSLLAVGLGLLLVSLLADAFYLPGLAPTNFCRKEVKDALEEKDKNKCKVSSVCLIVL